MNMEYRYDFKKPLIFAIGFGLILAVVLFFLGKVLFFFKPLQVILSAGFIILILFVVFMNYRKIELRGNELILYYYWRPKKVFDLREVKNCAIYPLKLLTAAGGRPQVMLFVYPKEGGFKKFAFIDKNGVAFAEAVVKKFEALGGKSKPVHFSQRSYSEQMNRLIIAWIAIAILYFTARLVTMPQISGAINPVINELVAFILFSLVGYYLLKSRLEKA